MLDLTAIKKTIDDYQNDDSYTNIGKLNLAAWLGERAHLLVVEIEELRQALKIANAALYHHPGGDNRSEDDIEQARALLEGGRCNQQDFASLKPSKNSP